MARTKKTKKSKAPLIIFIILIVLLVAAGITVYSFLQKGKNSDNVKAYSQAISEQTNQVTENLISEIHGLPETIQLGESEITPEEESKPENQQQTEARKAELQAELVKKYYEILEKQKVEAFSALESLINQAKQDYIALRNSGNKTPATLGNLMSEYMAKVDVMEAQMDRSFETVVGAMKQQLIQQGMDGASIIKEYKTQYNTIKEENRKLFMDKAFAALKK